MKARCYWITIHAKRVRDPHFGKGNFLKTEICVNFTVSVYFHIVRSHNVIYQLSNNYEYTIRS